MECERCLLTSDIVEIYKDGECEFCKIHDKLEIESAKVNFDKIVSKIKKQKGFQVLIGLSGGVDSCYLLHWAIKNEIKPLVVHFDN